NEIAITGAFLLPSHVVRVGATAFQVEPSGAAHAPAHSVRTSFGGYMGRSPSIVRLYPLLERLALSGVRVLLQGGTGTGKEVLAEALHEEGPRAARPFVVLDCTTLAPNLLEAELFGYERGAFTGAVTSRRGVFEQADGGTLLIDEIGDLDLLLQPKLLR